MRTFAALYAKALVSSQSQGAVHRDKVLNVVIRQYCEIQNTFNESTSQLIVYVNQNSCQINILRQQQHGKDALVKVRSAPQEVAAKSKATRHRKPFHSERAHMGGGCGDEEGMQGILNSPKLKKRHHIFHAETHRLVRDLLTVALASSKAAPTDVHIFTILYA